jgi:hypothetical protein
MKGKIIVAMLCLMLVIPIFSVADQITEKQINEKTDTIQPLVLDEADVPVWQIGNSWTYAIDTMQFVVDGDDISENLTIVVNANFDDLTLEVSDTSGDSYTVSILQTPINGDMLIDIDLGDGPVIIAAEFEETFITGQIKYNKDDLAITQFIGGIDGRLSINIVEQPYFDRSVFPKIPIPMTINIEIDIDTGLPIISFPLNETLQFWGIPALNISLDGTIESRWLNIFDFINQKIRDWGLITPIARLLQINPAELQNLSDMIDDILPTIHIKYVLEEYLNKTNVISTPEIPGIFYSNNTVNITVPAGTFEAYEINILGEYGVLYYSQEVKNIIKIEGNFEEVLPFLSNINAELIAYS